MSKKGLKRLLITSFAVVFVCFFCIFGINGYVKSSMAAYILETESVGTFENADCILVLGCKVYSDGRPSPMLKDRLNVAAELFYKGAAPKLLMSGDHGRKDYDEVRTMKNYMVDENIADSEDVFMDHAGFSTYESMYRAKAVFNAKRIIVVSQRYHLYRALFIAKRLGIEAVGVAAEDIYHGRKLREFREILARDKDFIKCIFKPKPTFLGEVIDIHGNGDATDD